MGEWSRRDFLRLAAAAPVGLAAAPTPATAPAPTPSRVVHVRDPRATRWDYRTGWYGDFVDQAVVDAMADEGMMELTRTRSRAEAWRAILPAYRPGQKVAIKINLNNAIYGSSGQVIDALPQPVNAVVAGLASMGVAEDDVWVYDMTNGWHLSEIPRRFMDKVAPRFPGVKFHSNDYLHSTAIGYSDTEKIRFRTPPGRSIPDRRLCNTVVRASYLIDMPIVKKHRMAGVTLSFKNHFGSFEGCDAVHGSTTLADPAYLPGYSGLVDIWRSPHIGGKTVLVVGDGLFAARVNNYTEVPSPWPTFGNTSPNSLFFARDPVAVDCVMYDLLAAEGGVPRGSDDYLKLAAAAGLGTFEHGDAAGRYRAIDLVRRGG